MIQVKSDRANLFGKRAGRQHEVTPKDVIDRINQLLRRNPAALKQLFRKHGIEGDFETREELIDMLSEMIAENDDRFNNDLARLLAQPRYSGVVIADDVLIALIGGISAVLSGGLGFAKSGVDKKNLRDQVNAELRLSYLQSEEAAKKRKAQVALIVIAFGFVIVMIVMLSIFRPFAKTE